jgi:hypothetical protein
MLTIPTDPLEKLPDERAVCARLRWLEREKLRLRQLLRLLDHIRQDKAAMGPARDAGPPHG